MNTDKSPDNAQTTANQPDQARAIDTDIENAKSVSGNPGVLDRVIASIPKQIKTHWFWILAYGSNLVYFIFALISANHGNSDPFTIPMFPEIIFTCIIFVQIFADPIDPMPSEGLDQEKRERFEKKRAHQRYKWMIFAYSFMLLSLVLTIYPFINPFFGKSHENAEKLREKPISVLIGCSSDSKNKSLSCSKSETTIGANGKLETKDVLSNGSWIINIGGHINQCRDPNTEVIDKYGHTFVCPISDGLLVPLYFIILALMGGSISLTRRLPELQKQAGSEHVATEQQPKLTQYEFREHLIFQIVQFISAPFLAILAFYLVDPSNTTNSVALAFTAGFASETILLMIRSIANKITPGTITGPQYGAIAGVITFKNVMVKKAEVFLSESPQIRSVTDEQGFYLLSNVPVGEHSISIKSIDNEEILKKDTVKIDRAQAIVKKNVMIIAEDLVQK
jgi:hypothetical protein